MVFIFYQLALNPDKTEKLYQEVRDVDIKDVATLKKLPYLNAVIEETLRLHPAVPTGGHRDTPPEGMMIGGTFIPGNTTVVAPRYTLGRCELIPSTWESPQCTEHLLIFTQWRAASSDPLNGSQNGGIRSLNWSKTPALIFHLLKVSVCLLNKLVLSNPFSCIFRPLYMPRQGCRHDRDVDPCGTVGFSIPL